MLVAENRPRTLKWYHAGALLFGDWGTSRLYVLGLAFYYSAHASVLYMAVMSVLMVGVAWAYTVICRTFDQGGGVYAIARLLSRTLSVLGATLLLGNFAVTAALSIIDGLHYFGVPHDAKPTMLLLAVVVIVALGLINWIGARNAGRFAVFVAVAALGLSFVVAVLSAPFFVKGLSTLSWGHPAVSGWPDRWGSFVHIVLALSGVEAVANMTGLMRQPVARTAKKTIWPVLVEVVVLNMVFGIAISGLPDLTTVEKPHYVHYEREGRLAADAVPDEVKQYRDTAVKVLAVAAAERVGGPKAGAAMGLVSGVVFGLLLLSAANTAIMAMVSVLYSMSRDGEIPRWLSRLNYSGVPWMGLIVSCLLPAALLFMMSDVGALAKLYAIGVCGAIAISILGCVINRELPIRRWERAGMLVVGLVILAVELTIIFTEPRATGFASALVLAILGPRQFVMWRRGRAPEPTMPEPETGWLAEVKRAAPALDPRRPRIMLAARGRYQAEFAVDLARKRGAVLFVIYVRTLRLIDVQPGRIPRVEDDPVAQESLGTAAMLAHQAGVPFVPVYVTSTDIAAEILDYTVTYGCDTLIMGKTRRSMFARRISGDVVAQVAEHLPDNVALLTRSADAPHFAGLAEPEKSGPADQA